MIELEDVWKVFGSDEWAVLTEARRAEPDAAVLKRLRAVIGVGGVVAYYASQLPPIDQLRPSA